MNEFLVAAAIFVCLDVAALGCLVLSARLPEHHRHDDTYNVVRLAANIFVVMTSLVLGLLINSSKNTFEAIDRNVHAFSTDLVLLDRSLRHYGPEASDVRRRLAVYLRRGSRARGAPTARRSWRIARQRACSTMSPVRCWPYGPPIPRASSCGARPAPTFRTWSSGAGR